MRKSSLGKRGTSTLPVQKLSLTGLPETSDGAANKGNCAKSLIPRISRTRTSSAECNSASNNWPGVALSTPQLVTPMQAGACASIIRNKGLRETSSKAPKDMRPLTDKNFQMLASQNIYNYFKENDVMDINAVPKTSTCSFTLKTFVTMINHLFSRIFPDEEITMTNYTEIIPILAKEVGYPTTVQKSWLNTVNSSRVIGLLSWLVDVVRAMDFMPEVMFPPTKQNIEKNDEDCDDSNLITSERFLQYYLDCFEKFNKDQDHDFEDQQIKQEAMNKLKVNDDDFKVLHNTLSKLEQHLSKEEVVREVEMNKELEGVKAKLLNELSIIDKSLQQKVAYVNKLQQKVEELECNIAKVESSKERLANNLSQMSKQLKTQPLTREDILDKQKKCSELEEDIKLEEASINMWSKENFALDLEMASVRSKLNVVCNDYSTLIYKNVDMFPELQDLKVQVNLLKQDATLQLQDLASCRDSLIKKLQIEIQEKETIIDERKETVHAQEQKVQELSDKLSQGNINIENIKQELTVLHDNFKRQRQNEMETLKKLQDELAKLKAGNFDCAPLKKRMQELEEADRIIDENKQSVRENAKKALQEIYEMSQEYGHKIEEEVKELLKY